MDSFGRFSDIRTSSVVSFPSSLSNRFDSRLDIERYSFLSLAAKAPELVCSRFCWSNTAEEADDPSVVELRVKLEEVMECAYDEVDEAET